MQNRIHDVRIAALACLAVVALMAPAAAQVTAIGDIETPLKKAFEGKRVTLRMDMPGSADGVDVSVDAGRALNLNEYRNDIRRYGVALRAGDSTTVTLVKMKKDLIEFQLAGGGFGTFGDDTSTSSNIKLLDKTEREKDLEKRIKNETDRDRKRSLQRELDAIQDRRERENRLLRAESERIEAMKREQIAAKRLTGGSRFNLRYAERVPANVRPDDVMKALAEYVDFDNASGNVTASWRPADVSVLRKGMSRGEVERAFGTPVERKEKREGGLVTTTLVFDVSEQRISADFVEDVLIRYAVTSK